MMNLITLPLIAHDTGTVAFWVSYRKQTRCRSWRGAMIHFAKQQGTAEAHLADDSAYVITRSKLHNSGAYWTHFSKDEVQWH